MATPRRPPDIVFILADDLGWSDLGCYGNTFHETPNLDALAAAGMRFTSAYAAGPVCSPTRAAIMCGKNPARLNLTTFLAGRPDRPDQMLLQPKITQHLPLEEVTVPELLRDAGYATASVGKWHLGGEPFFPEHQGFDQNVGGNRGGSPPGGYFDFRAPNLEAAGPDDYLTDRLTAHAERIISEQPDRPLFLYLSHYAVHIPLQPKPDLLAHYERKAAGLPPDAPHRNAHYAAVLHSLDESVGRVVRALRDAGRLDNTIIIFTSDNGGLSVEEGPHTPATTNAPWRAGKGHLYEGGVRVPLLISWPDVVAPGSTCDTPTLSTDFFPTLLEAAGVALPPAATDADAGANALGGASDGVSLLPLLTQTGAPARDALYWHFPHYSNQGGRPSGAVRRGDLKLIEFFEDGRVELYDLAADPGETNDLSAARPADAAELAGMLKAWREEVGARMPAANPEYEPGAER